MIKHLLKSIRKKPKAARDNIAMSIAGVFTVFIAIVWIYHLPAWYSAIEEKHSGKEAPGFSDIFGDFKDQFASAEKSKSTPTAEQASSTTPIITSELGGGPEVPVENWAMPKATGSDGNNFSTTSASSSEAAAPTNSAPLTKDPTPNEETSRPVRIITTSNAEPTTATTTAAAGQ
ncbi:MAG: hypothetical protein RLZZ230_311 [Candidatus Parcubacteria bacterium]|jgi:hypothetical protein